MSERREDTLSQQRSLFSLSPLSLGIESRLQIHITSAHNSGVQRLGERARERTEQSDKGTETKESTQRTVYSQLHKVMRSLSNVIKPTFVLLRSSDKGTLCSSRTHTTHNPPLPPTKSCRESPDFLFHSTKHFPLSTTGMRISSLFIQSE